MKKKNSPFSMPKPVKITGRSSSITNSFVNGIIPCITPTEEQVQNVLDILGMTADNVRCAYCGDKCTEWDHFRPLIIDRKATGYISEINNLVPACGKCNQSKGNTYWRQWMLGPAKGSPKTRNIPNLDLRVARLENFEKQSKPVKLDFESIVGTERWQEHWDNCERILELMRDSQILSDVIKDEIMAAYKKS